MKINRIFLDWQSSCLHQAADWLLEQAARSDEPMDLSQATLVVSGARAGRRLLEILVEKSAGRAMTPPDIITISNLPEKLYRPQSRKASDLTARMFMAQVIAQTPPEKLLPLLRHPPGSGDVISLLSLAGEFQKVAQELSGQQLSFEKVADLCSQQSLVDYDDQKRWRVLADLQNRYESLLQSYGMQDADMARRQALQEGRLTHSGAVVLIAVTDLPAMHRAMLQAIDGQVYALIHAPESLADAFDDEGVPITGLWEDRPTPVDEPSVHLVDRPLDQAYEISRIIAQYQPLPHADQITVGLGDPQLGPLACRSLEATGEDLAEVVFAHPTLSEAMHESVLSALGRPLNA